MPEFCLSLGSNVGDREASLESALGRLHDAGLALDRVSSVYETEPVGEAAGDRWFLNLAACGVTELSASDLVALCRRIEHDGGRQPGIVGGPRSIDIDLLLYSDWFVDATGCQVPHPRMHLRRFVLEPLAEIAGGAIHPVLDRTVAEILADLDDPARVVRRSAPVAGR